MKKSKIKSLSGYQKVLENTNGYMYRGVSDSGYRLIPKSARNWHLPLNSLNVIEDGNIEEFKVKAVPYLEITPKNEWEWFALAQHHGLPTRLLDWSLNPLLALYFACRENPNKDGAVYVAHCINKIDINEVVSPFDVSEELSWRSQHISKRIHTQDGIFTVSPNPLKDFSKGVFCRIDIVASAKYKLIKILQSFGIHHATVFPGLDSLAKHISDENQCFYGQKDKDKFRAALEREMERRDMC